MDRKITSWNISITWSDDEKEDLYDVPDHVANVVDEWFNKIEEKEQEFMGEE